MSEDKWHTIAIPDGTYETPGHYAQKIVHRGKFAIDWAWRELWLPCGGCVVVLVTLDTPGVGLDGSA